MKLLSLLLGICVCAGLNAGAQVKSVRIPLDGYAATVNTNVITIGDVYESIQEASLRLRALYSGRELDQKTADLFLSGLEKVIDQMLIVEESRAQKLEVPERLVDEEINTLVAKKYNGDRAGLLADLAESQITLEEYREVIRNQLIVRMMRSREIGGRIVITPRQIMEAYEARKERFNQPAQVRLSMIYRNAGTKVDQVRTEMSGIREKLAAGESFASLAREKSEDPSATSGGDWGWIEPGQLRAELRDAIQNAGVGNLSGIIEIPEGFYILKVEERKEARTPSFDDVRGDIERELREKQGEQYYREWIKRLRNKFPVIYHLPAVPDQKP